MPEHTSIMVNEILDFFSEKSLSVFVDGTLGAGGHAEAFLQAHPEIETFIGIDQDPVAREISQERLEGFQSKLQIVAANFCEMSDVLKRLGIDGVDGVFLDLGVSSMQLDRPEKGFSFMRDGPLDMRMNPDADLDAEKIVNEWPAEELQRIFKEFGEEPQSRFAARLIVEARTEARITRTKELADLLERRLKRPPKKHPATRVFQALRIAVNAELDVLEKGLLQAIELLRPGGRLAVLTFHSLEGQLPNLPERLFQLTTQFSVL